MQKTIMMLALSFAAAPAFAFDSPCVTKQKNAASFAVAQELAVAVQGAEIINFEPGQWTEGMAENTGSNRVTVRIGNRVNRAMTIKKFDVHAKQIDASDDCNILGIAEVER